MLLLDITIVNVALPDIARSLGSSFTDLQWVIDAYALSLAALLLTAGSLADLFGRRRVFVIGLVIFTVGSVACGAAQDIFFLQVSRAFQGIGGAAMFATALALLASAFHGKDRGTAFGVFGATTGSASSASPSHSRHWSTDSSRPARTAGERAASWRHWPPPLLCWSCSW
jgi:MFS family permease